MMPVPPPEILELGTAVAATLLNVTLVIFAFVAVVFSHATPMTTILSDPLPRVWDQLKDEMAVVEAALLAALKEICAKTGAGNTWSEGRIRSLRSHIGLPSYDPARLDERCVTLEQAAERLGVAIKTMKRLIEEKILDPAPVAVFKLRDIDKLAEALRATDPRSANQGTGHAAPPPR
jgi:hypothetical protein